MENINQENKLSSIYRHHVKYFVSDWFKRMLIERYIGNDFFNVSKQTQKVLLDDAVEEYNRENKKVARVRCEDCGLFPLKEKSYYSKELKRRFCGVSCLCHFVLHYNKLNMIKRVL